MEINEKELLKWIKALRSGKYKQTRGKLQDENGYCCLGVACEVLIPEKKKLKCEKDKRTLYGYSPMAQPNAPKWLRTLSFGEKTGTLGVATLNDVKGFSFDEIADLLELVYIHKALD